jgi:gluconolactonase
MKLLKSLLAICLRVSYKESLLTFVNILFMFQLFSQPTPLFTASDFTPEGEFTGNCEGPSVDSKGNIYAVNIKEDGTIAKITKDGKTEIFLKLPNGSIGNGIRFGDKNTFYVADFKKHNVLKVSLLDKSISVFCHESKMNQPNDLAIMKNGIIFCSDPNWKESKGQIWRVNQSGEAKLVMPDMGTTNGIEVSPDNKKLYVNESVQRNVWQFDIDNEGNLSNKKLLIKFEDGGMDGMRCDAKGNLYITRHGKGEINIVSPEGKILQIVKTKGLKTSNICFGGKDGKTCYVTLQDRGCLETFRTDTAGREWMMMNKK